MAAPMVKTGTPGIYKRGRRYAFTYYDRQGRQRKGSAATYDEARKLKAAKQADADRGELAAQARITFRAYAEEWIERYQGRGRGFRESTRTDYRRHLTLHAFPYFGDRKRLTDLTPRDMSSFVAWLMERRHGKAKKPLSDATIRHVVNTVRACLATAVREGMLRHNPARETVVPLREDDLSPEPEKARVFTREQLEVILATVHADYRLMFRFLAATGLRWSELVGLQWKHLHLSGSRPHVKVRQAMVRGKIGRPKSKAGIRDVPIDQGVVFELRRRRRDADDGDLVFTTSTGTPLDHTNTLRRVLRPVAEEVGAEWAGFHTFRHTCASMLFARGANAKQVQTWLGHHSAAFTLDTYVHLIGDEGAAALDLSTELGGGKQVASRHTETDENAIDVDALLSSAASGIN